MRPSARSAWEQVRIEAARGLAVTSSLTWREYVRNFNEQLQAQGFTDARLDPHGVCLPKTHLVARVEVPPDDGRRHGMVVPPANEYVAEDGTRVPLR